MLKSLSFMRIYLSGNVSKCMLSSEAKAAPSQKQILMKLRSKTNYPLISCKEALKATGYDLEKAELYLVELAKKKGWEKMTTGKQNIREGLISILTNKTSAAIVEVNCETDFVAKTKEFQDVVKTVADVSLNTFQHQGKISIPREEILKLQDPNQNQSIEDTIALTIGKLKENVIVRRVTILTPPPEQSIAYYIHPSMLVKKTTSDPIFGGYGSVIAYSKIQTNDPTPSTYFKLRGKQLAQHIVGMQPTSIGIAPKPVTISVPKLNVSDDFDNEIDNNTTDDDTAVENLLHEKDVSENTINANVDLEAPKETMIVLPADENSDELLKQPFLLESDVSVAHWMEFHSLQIHDFVRFQVGELSDT